MGLTSLGYVPLKLLISTSVYSLGVVGGFMAALKGLTRGEISELTSLVYDAREQVFDRMEREAKALGADQVVGVKAYIVELGASLIEVFCVGTAVRQLQGPKVMSQALPAIPADAGARCVSGADSASAASLKCQRSIVWTLVIPERNLEDSHPGR
jgi:uncharacterized protein YbjQ (UPF0145 family)